jgi:hypothetical protein
MQCFGNTAFSSDIRPCMFPNQLPKLLVCNPLSQIYVCVCGHLFYIYSSYTNNSHLFSLDYLMSDQLQIMFCISGSMDQYNLSNTTVSLCNSLQHTCITVSNILLFLQLFKKSLYHYVSSIFVSLALFPKNCIAVTLPNILASL